MDTTTTINGVTIDLRDCLRSLDVMIVHGVARDLNVAPAIVAAALRKTGRINISMAATP